MSSNDTDVTVGIGATNNASGVLNSAINDFKNFWKSASGQGDAAAASSNMDTLASKLGISNKALIGAGIAGGVVAAGAIAIGVSAIKAATNFQQMTETLVTGAGESEKNIASVRSGILNLSDATGQSTQQLTSGMFMIESAGYHGAAGLNVLKASAEGAKVGNADLGAVADATTTIMKDYSSSGITASGAVNTLVATVANGKTHMEDLTNSMAKLLPVASSMGIGLNQVMGAMATMTGEGTSARMSANDLSAMFKQFAGTPTKTMQAAMDSVGLSSSALSKKLQTDVPGAMQMITDAVSKKFPQGSLQFAAAIKGITGNAAAMQGVLELGGKNVKDFGNNIQAVTDQVKKGGNSITGWNDVQKDEQTQMEKAKVSIQNAKIALGEGLLPAVTDITKAIVKIVTPIAEWINSHQKLAAMIIAGVAAIGAFVATTLVAVKVFSLVKDAVMAVRTAAIALNTTFLTNPITLAIMAIIVVVLLMVTHWNDVKKWFDDFFRWFKQNWELVASIILLPLAPALLAWRYFHDQITAFIGDVINWIKANWKTILDILLGPVGAALFMWQHFHDQIIGFIRDAVGTIEGIWGSITGFMGRIISDITSAIRNGVSGFGNLLYNAGKDLLQGFINGVENMADNVMNTVKNIGNKAVSALKGVLKIFSPSQVFAELGQYVGAGLVQGIQGTEANVTQATSNLGTAAIVGGTNAIQASTPVSNNNINNSSSSHNVTIQNLQLVMPNGATMQTFIQSLNQDSINAGKGLSVVQGAY